MRVYVDESGDFAFPEDRYDCYVQAALVLPDSLAPDVDAFVAAKLTAWNVDELHATAMTPGQLLATAEFIAGLECQLIAHATDTELTSCVDIREFRLDQAAATRRNLDWYRRASTTAIGAPAPDIEKWMMRQIKRAGLATQISHAEFVQAHYLIVVLEHALRESLIRFESPRWGRDLREFRFTVDGKLDGKLAAGEKYVNEVIVPVLGSRPGSSLVVPSTWSPSHPFVSRFYVDHGRIFGRDVEGAIDLKAIFEHGVRFESSDLRAGLQLVDTVAHVVRGAVLQPENPNYQSAFDVLRPRLVDSSGLTLTVNRLRTATNGRSAATLDRYRPLAYPRS